MYAASPNRKFPKGFFCRQMVHTWLRTQGVNCGEESQTRELGEDIDRIARSMLPPYWNLFYRTKDNREYALYPDSIFEELCNAVWFHLFNV